jgi:ABC-type glycerol-3-phosphate transport system substrate-binding protein
MSTQLDWRIGDDDQEPPERQQLRWRLTSLTTIAFLIVAALMLALVWHAGKQSALRAERRLQQEVQEALDRQQRALWAGDGDLFFATFSSDPAWRMAQLRPEFQEPIRAGLTVSRASSRGDEIWANVSWSEAGNQLQRAQFFRREAGRIVQIPAGSEYWQQQLNESYPWGRLRYNELDREWAPAIAEHVARTISDLCAAGCRPGKLPVELTIAANVGASAAPGEIRLPSPRLLALTAGGEPAPLFWRYLHDSLVDYLSPAEVRFAVPDELLLQHQDLVPPFEHAHPGLTVELIPFSALPTQQAELLAAVDGAMLMPDEQTLASGLVLDLTDYALSDPAFDQRDFYEQIWQGGWWHDRMWVAPQSAAMPLVYYDQSAYENAALNAPSLRWTWQEMSADLSRLTDMRTGADEGYAFLDEAKDALYSFAYSRQADSCRNAAPGCPESLSPQAIAAAYEWYAGITHMTPQLWSLPDEERVRAALTAIAFRRVTVWTSRPLYYEQELQRSTLGILPLPGSDRFDGVTPLWIQGNVITQHSRRPLATWQWITFLSQHYLAPQLRHVPARPSVAQETGFWSVLPRPLGDVMRTAFPFSRPIRLDERDLFSWENIAGVVSLRLTPAQAARSAPTVRWFSPSE